MSVLPAPFGFGIWTAHVTPTLLGAPMRGDAPLRCRRRASRSSSASASACSPRSRRSSSCCSNAPTLADRDLLEPAGAVHRRRDGPVPARGGVRGPHRLHRAAVLRLERDRRAVAAPRSTDDREHRLRTAGRVIPEMHVRLFDDDGADVTATAVPGSRRARGAVNCLGYYDDPEANARLYTADGWMLTGDFCTIDADGYLTVAGRASDFIIRGGKNISAAQVEDEVVDASVGGAGRCGRDAGPGVRRARVRVRRAAARRDAARRSTRCARTSTERGVGKELWPERLVVVDALPRVVGRQGRQGRPARRHRGAARREPERPVTSSASDRRDRGRPGRGRAGRRARRHARCCGSSGSRTPRRRSATSRWRAPAPAEPVDRRPRRRPAFGPRRPQAAGVRVAASPRSRSTDDDEDCLTLNVWTPALAGDAARCWSGSTVAAYLSGGEREAVYDARAPRRRGRRRRRHGELPARRARLPRSPTPTSDARTRTAGCATSSPRSQWVARARRGVRWRSRVGSRSSASRPGRARSCTCLGSPPPAGASAPIVQSGEPRTLTAELARPGPRRSRARHARGDRRRDVDALRAVPVDALLDAQTRCSPSSASPPG